MGAEIGDPVFLITAFASPAPTPLRPLPAFARTHPTHAQPTECATREVIRSTHTSGCARPQDPLGVTSNPKVADKRSRKVSERCLTRTIIEEFNSEVHRLESPKVSETSASARPDCARAPRSLTVQALSNAVAHARPASSLARRSSAFHARRHRSASLSFSAGCSGSGTL